MITSSHAVEYTCLRCLTRQYRVSDQVTSNALRRCISTFLPHREQQTPNSNGDTKESSSDGDVTDETMGALSRRLAEMTDDTIESGGRTAAKAIEEAGFSEELTRRLAARIQDSGFRNENSAAFAQMNMPVYCNVTVEKEGQFADPGIDKCWERHATDCSRSALVRYRNSRRCSSEDAHRCT